MAQGLGKASSFISGRAKEKAHGKHSWICVETSLLARAENTIIFFKFPQYKEYYGTSRLGQLSCYVGLTIQHVFKLRVVPHFSSGIVEKNDSPRLVSPFLAWGDFHARSRFARSTIPEEKWGTTRSLARFSVFANRSLHRGLNPHPVTNKT